MKTQRYLVFADFVLAADGDLRTALTALHAKAAAPGSERVLVFDGETGRQTDFDLRGSLEEALERNLPREEAEAPAKAGKGRPRLGVVSAEVTLLPRHWDWLAAQPAKASGTLRRLVDEARAKEGDRKQRTQALGNLLWSLAGDQAGFEEATRRLYAGDLAGFYAAADRWPGDLPRFVRSWFAPAPPPEADAADIELIEDLFADAPRQGPGSDEQTLKALSFVGGLGPAPRIADLGCGSGAQTLALARALPGAGLTAVDRSARFLERLEARAGKAGLAGRIETVRADLAALPFPDASFDLVWAEGSAYSIGFDRALESWRRLLVPGGRLCATELCWLGPERPGEAKDFWTGAYPPLRGLVENAEAAERLGYRVEAVFALPPDCWTASYYEPLAALEAAFLARRPGTASENLVAGLREEREQYARAGNALGYAFFVLRKA